MNELQVVFPYRLRLGECPTWSVREQALYWIDIPGDGLFRKDWATGETRHWPMPTTIGSFGLFDDGTLLLALRTGFRRFDPGTGTSRPIGPPPDYDPAVYRYNDGRADRRGRFWVGTMHEPRTRADAKLYCYDPATDTTAVKVDGVTLSNGLAFAPDDKTVYYADTQTLTIWAFDFEIESGALSRRRVFVQLDQTLGRPDGAAVDAEGGYWIAVIGKVARFDASGRLDRVVELPMRRITMCSFGGPDLRTLFITSASETFTAAALDAEPLAGVLVGLDVGVAGLPEPLLKSL